MSVLDSEILTELAARLGGRAHDEGFTVATAESLTGGLLSNALAQRKAASEWFRGGVVAYASEVKFQVLGVRPGPVVTEEAARQMARGVADLLGADLGVATTGVGGPDPEEGLEPGTVWLAARGRHETITRLHHFDGDPEAVCAATCKAALELAWELTERTPFALAD